MSIGAAIIFLTHLLACFWFSTSKLRDYPQNSWVVEMGCENNTNGFNYLVSFYWAFQTISTVGYGDIAPVTVLGQTIASVIMLIGYAIIAVPTGIIGSELVVANNIKPNTNTHACQNCNAGKHDDDAKHCNQCGEVL